MLRPLARRRERLTGRTSVEHVELAHFKAGLGENVGRFDRTDVTPVEDRVTRHVRPIGVDRGWHELVGVDHPISRHPIAGRGPAATRKQTRDLEPVPRQLKDLAHERHAIGRLRRVQHIASNPVVGEIRPGRVEPHAFPRDRERRLAVDIAARPVQIVVDPIMNPERHAASAPGSGFPDHLKRQRGQQYAVSMSSPYA